jgi:type IV pilus assembly protein PilM
MDDQSLWKKELSFGRKPEDEKDGDESPPTDEKPTSVWKKELSLKRESKDAVEGDAAASATVDEPVVEEPVVAEPAGAEPAPEQDEVWTKEVSFSRTPAAEPDTAPEPIVAAEPVATEDETWKKEVSFSRAPAAEPLAAPADGAPVGEEETVADEQALADEPVVAQEPVAVELDTEEPLPSLEIEAEPWAAPPSLPPAPLPEAAAAIVPAPIPPVDTPAPVAAVELPLPGGDVPKVPFWKKELSLGGKRRDKPVKERPTASVPEPTDSVDVHPPVAATDLPAPLEAPKVPFWKKDISLGSKKRDKPVEEGPALEEGLDAIVSVPTPSVEVHPPVTAAELPPLPEAAPKVPFWKKELSLGGNKRDKPEKPAKPAKERKQKAPKVKAERAPKTEEPKQPKEPKERKQKAPKVKVERGSSKGRIVGLKIGASQLAAARVSNNGSAELLQVAREPLAPGIVVGGELRDPEALAEALKDFFTKHGLPKKGVRLGIANNRIGVRTFEIAGIDDQKQLANAIRFRAQETLPIPIDEAVLDYHLLGEGVGADGQATKRVLLVVAYRELIDRYVDACKKAGITLVGIDLEAFALLRALQAPQEGVGTDATAALVVVAIGHDRSTFAVSDGRVCEFTRVLEWGGSALNVAIARAVDAAPSEVEGAKRALALTDEMVPEGLTAEQAKNARDSMRRAIQTFARELVSSLQYYQNQPGSLGIGEIVLTGGTAHLPGLSGELERLIGVHVRVGDPLARMKVSKKVGQPEQIGSLAVAIGLGIED